MKRLLAILLLLALGLPGATPLFALSSGAEGKVPSCCRRNGRHHCASANSLGTGSDSTTLSAIPSSCPLYPSALPASQQVVPAIETSPAFEAALAVSPAAAPPIVAVPRNALSFNRAARGPPAVILNFL